MSDEAPKPALVVRAAQPAPEKAPDTRPRVGGVLAHRLERFREAVENQLLRDVKDVAMKDYAFLSDEELDKATFRGKPLTARQKRVARAWESSKKNAAMALHASHERVINALRAQVATPGVSINVETAVIRVPPTRPDHEEDPIVIDVEASSASD